MLSQRIILSDSSIIGTLDNWDSFTAAGNRMTAGLTDYGLYCESNSTSYHAAAGITFSGMTAPNQLVHDASSFEYTGVE